MVSELLEPTDDLVVASSRSDIQVTGKVAVTASSPSVSTTSVIRRSPPRGQSSSPDSPDSNASHEDSTWFLRQVLQRGTNTTNDDQEDEIAERAQLDSNQIEQASPLTPATSPARGLRRPRPSESEDDNENDEDESNQQIVVLKTESNPEATESKRARVETIVSTMRISTSTSTSSGNSSRPSETLNAAGCKKRKLYQPQQHDSAKFTSEGEEEEDDDERNDDSLISENEPESAKDLLRSVEANHSGPQQLAVNQQPHDPLRSLQDRIASLQQQRYTQPSQSPVSHDSKHNSNPEVRRPVRDDSGRSRHSGPLNTAGINRTSVPTDLSQLTQAHAAYIDATRRLLMDQQQQHQHQQQRPLQRQPIKTSFAQEPTVNEFEGLAEMLKSELASSLAQLIDNTLSRFAQQQRRNNATSSNTPTKFTSSLDANNADMESNKLQRGRVIDRGLRNGDLAALGLTPFLRAPYAAALPHLFAAQTSNPLNHIANSLGSMNSLALANIGSYGQQQQQQQAPQSNQPQHQQADQPQSSPSRYSGRDSAVANDDLTEQNEALSLVVSPKKRRPVKTSDRDSPAVLADTRLSPLEISLAGNSCGPNSPPLSRSPTPSPANSQRFTTPQPTRSNGQQQPPPTHSQHPQLLHHPTLFSNYSAYFAAAAAGAAAAAAASRTKSPESERSPPSASLLHPALLATHTSSAHLHRHHHHSHSDSLNDRHSDSSDGASPYDGIHQSSTLTPMHLRKAKLMFFWVRYPSSSVLKTFFPDVKFNKNNTAQLVKWFSNFREFYYIQMEKYGRQLLSEGLVNAEDIHISTDSELFRVLNLHYNRNNHIEVPPQFVYVVTQTMREFFKAIQAGKDAEPSWKKAIYKIIARLDEQVPEYFRTPNFLEHLE